MSRRACPTRSWWASVPRSRRTTGGWWSFEHIDSTLGVANTFLAYSRNQSGRVADGSYTVRDLAVGEARVAVNSPNPRSIVLVPNKDPSKKQEPYPDVPGWFAIPAKYENQDTSGLTITIKGGWNKIDLE